MRGASCPDEVRVNRSGGHALPTGNASADQRLRVSAESANDGGRKIAEESLEAFLGDVQARALTMARMATGDVDEALDLVQDAMTAFVRRYARCPSEQRRPLFYRVLNNRITDWYRRRARWRLRIFGGFRASDEYADGPDPMAEAAPAERPDGAASDGEFALALERALARLPVRQRQVFLLRAWEGMDVREAASALGIGEGSIKTHYFRALASLRQALEAHDDRHEG
jgi:RNA polymerase sigma-70 factor (ECF subfamily)